MSKNLGAIRYIAHKDMRPTLRVVMREHEHGTSRTLMHRNDGTWKSLDHVEHTYEPAPQDWTTSAPTWPISAAQWQHAEALYVQSEKDRKEWHGIALRTLAERDALLTALVGLTRHAAHNLYPTEPLLKAALIAICKATGKSTFGNDWMNALDQLGDTQ